MLVRQSDNAIAIYGIARHDPIYIGALVGFEAILAYLWWPQFDQFLIFVYCLTILAAARYIAWNYDQFVSIKFDHEKCTVEAGFGWLAKRRTLQVQIPRSALVARTYTEKGFPHLVGYGELTYIRLSAIDQQIDPKSSILLAEAIETAESSRIFTAVANTLNNYAHTSTNQNSFHWPLRR